MGAARTAIIVAAALALPATATAQCTETHLRWTEKTTLSLAGLTPVYATINQMLTSWAIPAIYAGPSFKCTDRAGRELRN